MYLFIFQQLFATRGLVNPLDMIMRELEIQHGRLWRKQLRPWKVESRDSLAVLGWQQFKQSFPCLNKGMKLSHHEIYMGVLTAYSRRGGNVGACHLHMPIQEILIMSRKKSLLRRKQFLSKHQPIH